MRKRLLSVLLALTLLAGLIPLSAGAEDIRSGTWGENLTWTLDGGVLTIGGTGPMENDGTPDCPYSWLSYASNIESVVIQEGVTDIGAGAFRSTDLKTIRIPSSVEKIGEGAFRDNFMLHSITIPGTVRSIGDSAFRSCNALDTITIQEGVTEIGKNAFRDDSSVKNVTLPDSIDTIGHCAFAGCSRLAAVTIPDRVEHMGLAVFADCPCDACNTAHWSDPFDTLIWELDLNGVLTFAGEDELGDYSGGWKTYADQIREIVIQDGFSSIGMGCFQDLTALERVSIPDSVTRIGSAAFFNCSSLREVSIPGSVEIIDSKAFADCSAISKLTLESGLKEIRSTAFSGCAGIPEVVIPEGVTSIGDKAFSDCTALKRVVIPESVSHIGSYAFSQCSALTDVTMPDDVPQMGENVFAGSPVQSSGDEKEGTCGPSLQWKLSSDGILTITGTGEMTDYDTTDQAPWSTEYVHTVVLHEGVTGIGSYAFQGCHQLREAVIPNSVTRIGENAFASSALKEITIPGSVECVEDRAFMECRSLKRVTAEEGVRSVGKAAFLACHDLREVLLPDSVTQIGGYAFENCSALETVILPKGLSVIEKELFNACWDLQRIAIPAGVTEIGENAFFGCSSLRHVNYRGTQEQWDRIAISNDGNGNAPLVNAALHFIGDGTPVLLSGECGETAVWELTEDGVLFFRGSGAMDRFYSSDLMRPWMDAPVAVRAVVIEDGITDIGIELLANCTTLQRVQIPGSVERILFDAFRGCSGLTAVTIPKGVKDICSYAFSGCTGLTAVVIPDGVKSIDSYAFSGCTGLKEIDLPGSLKWIEGRTFENCTALERLTLRLGVNYIEKDAFSGCTALKDVYFEGHESQWNYVNTAGCTEIHAATMHYGVTGVITLDSGTVGDSIAWTYDSDGTLRFTGTGTLPFIPQFPYISAKAVVIGEGITKIGDNAFQFYSHMAELRLPESLQEIGNDAFFLSEVTSLRIPAGVTKIGTNLRFNHLQAFEVDPANPAYQSVDGALLTRDGTELIAFPGGRESAYTIPAGVRKIAQGAFDQCALKGLVIPEGVSEIPDNTLRNCYNLTSVELPSSLRRIGDRAFYDCGALRKIVIPEGVTRIGTRAFDACFALRIAVLPTTLQSMGPLAMNGRDTKAVYYNGTEAQWNAVVREQNDEAEEALHGVTIQFGDLPEAEFRDVKASAFYAKPVEWAVESTITKGTGKETFAPNQDCTRGQIVTFLWRSAGEPEPKSTENPFTDVRPNAYYYKAVLWAVEQGITKGTSETTFSPNESCTRAQAVTFMYRANENGASAMSVPAQSFTDVAPGKYYYQAVDWAVRHNVTKGTSATSFSPNDICTRGQIVTFLYRGDLIPRVGG